MKTEEIINALRACIGIDGSGCASCCRKDIDEEALPCFDALKVDAADRLDELQERCIRYAEEAMEQKARLKAYEDAERDGRLVVLPCKVGDTVWVVWSKESKEVVEAKVCCIRPFMFADRAEVRGNALLTFEDPFYDDGRPLTQEIFIIFGKDAFLTREEAEAALAKAVMASDCGGSYCMV